jgi:hypothetical protein
MASKSSGPLIIAAGAAALLLMGGKKKKKSSTEDDGTKPIDDGTTPSDGGGTTPSGNGGTTPSGGGGKSHSDKAKKAGGIWVSSDCKEVEYENGTPEAWWNRRGKSAAENFLKANYHDPYEIARALILQIAPCAVEFPVLEDGFEPMEEEYKREQFLRAFPDVYYLIQWLHDAIYTLMDKEEYIVEFDDRCDLVFMGDKWLNPIAQRMVRFYLDYMYPMETDYGFVPPAAWEGADITEDFVGAFSDNVAMAVINRMHPTCAWEILEAFKKNPGDARSFFSTRPGMKAAYNNLIDLVNYVDDNRPSSFEFEPMS